ncbi:MAG: hypothetical protein ACI4LC_07745 [Emergencia sp.]
MGENQGEPGENVSGSGNTEGESESGNTLENNTVDNPVENTTNGLSENVNEPLMTLSSNVETFASLGELQTFYQDNSGSEGLSNALSFSGNVISANAVGLILLSCVEGEDASFKDKTIKLNGLSGSDANLTGTISGFDGIKFRGLGREDHPFKGTLTVSEASSDAVNVIIDRPLFNALDVTYANLSGINALNIKIAKTSATALADTIYGAGQDWGAVEVNIEAYTYAENESVTVTYPGSCIGTVKENADFSLKKVCYKSKADVNEPSENAGLLCNTMESGSKLTVNSVVVAEGENSETKITSGNAAAGGLVGYINENAEFSAGATDSLTIDGKWTITGKSAGALIGEAKDVVLNVHADVNGAKVISSVSAGSAGGLIGTYHLTSEDSVFNTYDAVNGTIQVKDVVLDAIGDNSYIGALFGVLELSKDFSIQGGTGESSTVIKSTAGFTQTGSSYNLKGTTSYGGLVGQVYGTDSNTALSALIIDGKISAESSTNNDITYYGGLVGIIGKPGIDDANPNGAYVVINSDVITECKSERITAANHYFGGAVGGMFYHSVFEIAKSSTFTPTATNIKFGGGIVGAAARGSTLRLAGKTDLTGVTFTAHALGQNPGIITYYRNANGQIAGIQNAALIYAAKSWVLTRPNNPGEIDDIGNYGSVIRLGGNVGKGETDLGSGGGLSDDLITQDLDTHKTVFKNAAPLNGTEISISNADEFALLSIAEQTYGDFGIYPDVTNGHIISDNNVTRIALNAGIDLSNTGVSGLQRDFYGTEKIYTGEFDGQGYTLTLDVGQIYAATGTGAGNGQIHGHCQVGLFSQANATIKNLTISGNINVRERKVSDATKKSTMAVGGCIALSTGGACTFENVTTNVRIQCAGNGTESHIGGLIGLKQGNSSTVTISGCNGSAAIIDETSAGSHTIGGMIGTYAGGGTITVNNTTLNGSITGGDIADAKYGGLISVIKDNSATIYLNNLTIDGQIIENDAVASSGGLLGYEWNNSTVYFGDSMTPAVTVEGDSAVKVTGNAKLGALVYQATGYWQVNNLYFNKASIQNQAGDLGLMICYGRKGTQLLYLEETKHNGYNINSGNVTVSSTGGYFDEWVVYTAESAENIINNGNSVISIATEEKEDGSRKGFDPTGGTSTGYQNKTTNNGIDWITANPNARYYYDLDAFRKSSASSKTGYIDTTAELVLWSVWRYSGNSNIKQYFETADIKEEKLGGNNVIFDLTGYSYYPVNVDAADVAIENCTVVFANDIINSAEEKVGVSTGTTLDNMIRTTSGTSISHTQHYLMHSGLILNYQNTSKTKSSATLSVKNITLQGTIGKGTDQNGSGAIICGTVSGSGEGGNHFARVELNEVKMDSLTINCGDIANEVYAPLLINTVGSYGGIDAQQISTLNYSKGQKVATSLIGNVGNAEATNISLAFYNGIALSGKADDSIFTRASLLESFQYNGASSSGYYHFNKNDQCTYGREIEGTKENLDDEGNNLQLYYFDSDIDTVKDGENTAFNNDTYLPYVYKTKVMDEELDATYHELEINIKKPNLINGCGTYDDPYIINQATQLQLVAQYIGGTTTAGWQVNMVKTATEIDNGTGNNHTTFTYDNTKWSDGSNICNQEDMRNYLCNAYYKLDDSTAEPLRLNRFMGLGTMDNPFRGVVDGSGRSVIINAENITSGFVNVSYGSVIQNINITYTGEKQKLSNNPNQAALNSNAVANESYFGGIIGDVKGGDNLIKNVSVDYSGDFKVGIQHHLECVGGLFGIVEGGGVILSNMQKQDGLNSSQLNTSLADKDLAYVSPLIGRVLDGFIINETETTADASAFESNAGSDKNYTIGNISASASLTAVVNGSTLEVKIDDEEKLLLLSVIINSGACNGGWSIAYKTGSNGNAYKSKSGKVRNADYSKIGKLDTPEFKTKYFDLSRDDDAIYPSATNLPYLITEHAGENSSFWNSCLDNSVMYLDLSITKDLDMSVYKNGYRGIGGRYNCTASSSTIKDSTQTDQTSNSQFQRNTPSFVAFNGNNKTLKVDNRISGYSDDNFVAIAAGGLVNMLRRKPNTELVMQNLTVEGHVELHDFSDTPDSTEYTNASSRKYAASVGGVIGRYFTEDGSASNTTYLKLINLKVNDMELYSDGAAGGIVGQTGTKNFYPFGNATNQYSSGVTYTNCSYVGLTAISCSSTGGIVGAACDNANSFNYSDSNNTKITNKIIAIVQENETGFVVGKGSTLSVYAKTVSPNGLGGIIGNVGSNAEINDQNAKPIIIDHIILQYKDNSIVKNSVSRTGGAIGFLHHGTTKAYNVTVSNSTMGNGKEDNLGGIVGCWYSTESGGIMENIVIDGCSLDADLSVGGVIGYIANEKHIKNITVKNTVINQKSTSASRGVGLIIGQIYSGGIYGENILLKDNSVTAKTPSKGRIVGSVDTNKDIPIQLLGVSLQYGNDKSGNPINVAAQPQQDIGSIPYASYSNKTSKIFIAYDAFLTDKTSGSELDHWPSVSIPGIGDSNEITGDTANPYTITGSDTIPGIVNKVDSNYTYIGSNKNYQYVEPENVNKLLPGIVSTYNANQDTHIDKDFNVVQIDGSAAALKQYINAATNGAFATGVALNSDDVMKVDIKRYKWNSSEKKFADVTNLNGIKPTLTYDRSTGNFYATTQYDNQEDMFTLVSVTFKSTDTNKSYSRTYDIPVVVRRMLQVDFTATMASGTVFNASEMESYKTHALASVGEDITGYLTFRYNSNQSGVSATYDWQSYMEAGANLLGYYKKTLDAGSLDLPAGTDITLIDCQQSERRYHAVVPEGKTSKLELFNGDNLTFTHSDGTQYQPVSLAELLKIDAKQITDADDSGTKKWVSLGNVKTPDATVVATDGNYYRLYDSAKDGENATCFSLEITDPTPEENYFVVISIPKAENHMLTLIKSGNVTKGSMTWSDSVAGAPPIEVHQLHRYDKTEVNTNVSSEITFNFLDNYKQTLTDLVAAEVKPISSVDASVEMEFNLQNEISFKKDNYEESDPLYQELRVSLRKKVGSAETDVYFPSDAKATVELYAYYMDGDNKVYFTLGDSGKLTSTTTTETAAVTYDWKAGTDGNMVLPFAKLTNGMYEYIDLSPLRIAAKNQEKFYIEVKLKNPVSIGMSSVINNDLLPTRETSDSQNQTKMQFTSVLSFKESGLSYSTLRKSEEGNKGYYLNEQREAILKLDYLDVDQLGINLSDEYSGEISAILTLDLSGTEGFNSNLSKFELLNKSDTVKFDFSLEQKGKEGLSSVKYGDVTIGDYITDARITGGNTIDSFHLELRKADGSYPYYNEATGVFSIPITFKVNTENLEALKYSNYRIHASADLLKGGISQKIAINNEKAFITYTVAKININGIWQSQAGSAN